MEVYSCDEGFVYMGVELCISLYCVKAEILCTGSYLKHNIE
jgi:hypothetical protein